MPKPTRRPNEVLVRILAAITVRTGDWRIRSPEMPSGFGLLGRLVIGIFGLRRTILGTELAGIVESTGRAVTYFEPGEAVFAFPSSGFGSIAETGRSPGSASSP